MRRLLPNVRSFLTHSGQTMGLGVVAVLAMAAAPQAMHVAIDPTVPAAEAGPIEPRIKAEVEALGPPIRMMTFEQPVEGYRVNSRFGMRRLGGERAARRHEGIDIAAPTGTPIKSTAEGVVTATGYDAGGYGNFVEVRHPNGVRSFYAHMSRIEVRTGAVVMGGQRIGRVGSTGYSTGPHLHFEVRSAGRKLNPMNFLGRDFQVEMRA